MRSAFASSRTHLAFLAVAAAIVGLAFAIWGEVRGSAALAGAALAAANWFAVRFLTGRLIGSVAQAAAGESSGPPRALVSLLLVFKIGALMAAVYWLILGLRLDPVGLALGLGAMFLGPLAASLTTGGARPLSSSAAAPAESERLTSEADPAVASRGKPAGLHR